MSSTPTGIYQLRGAVLAVSPYLTSRLTRESISWVRCFDCRSKTKADMTLEGSDCHLKRFRIPPCCHVIRWLLTVVPKPFTVGVRMTERK